MANDKATKKMSGRAGFLAKHAQARAVARAALCKAEEAASTMFRALTVKPKQFEGKRALVLGSGVGGLTTAYELLKQDSGMKVTVLEARDRTGGRCMSLRTGDTVTEDVDAELEGSKPGETQTVRFERPKGDDEPYLNAGPGRIPSSHKRLLSYLKEFDVPIEVYIMNTQSNLVQMEDGPGLGADRDKPVVYRRIEHDTRGHIAECLYAKAEEVMKDRGYDETKVEKFKELLVAFGDLTAEGKYHPDAGLDGLEQPTSDRGGYSILPGVAAGETAKALPFDRLLESEFWSKTSFYQPQDFLWQPTSFQPVGGMDRVQHAFATQVAALGGDILLNHPVKFIDWDDGTGEFVVLVQKIGTADCDEFRCDYLFSNMAMPFLKNILSEKVIKLFDPAFQEGLDAVFQAQFTGIEEDDRTRRFLATTTKIGWQADRVLWQGSRIQKWEYGKAHHDVPDHELGVVPIFGGISWTSNEIRQIWYPSTGYHDEKGVLTGCYNFGDTAEKWGTWPVKKRLAKGKDGAEQLTGSAAFREGLQHGVAIAWQNVPYIKGGWAQWDVVKDSVTHFNHLAQGTAVGGNPKTEHPVFFVVGDQLSSLPGWQEGAIAAALNALNRLAHPHLIVPHLACLPDTRLMVEGI